MNLATPCGPGSEQYFYDLQTKSVGCITPAKSQGLQDRLAAEAKAKNAELLQLYDDVKKGKITSLQYAELKAMLNTLAFTENTDLSVAEASARFSNMRTALQKNKKAAA
jgi:hypothetical protein